MHYFPDLNDEFVYSNHVIWMAVTVILDFLNESCVAVKSPRDSLIPLDHVSALPN